MLQEERSIFWEVIVLVILSKKVCMHMYPIPDGFRDRAISLYRNVKMNSDEQHAVSSHKFQSELILEFWICIILGMLYQLCHMYNKCQYYKQYIISLLSTILELYRGIALSRKPFGIWHMYMYIFLLRMTYYNFPEYWPYILGEFLVSWCQLVM
jgi:hypothetical protein